jgi:hypothetical protein
MCNLQCHGNPGADYFEEVSEAVDFGVGQRLVLFKTQKKEPAGDDVWLACTRYHLINVLYCLATD